MLNLKISFVCPGFTLFGIGRIARHGISACKRPSFRLRFAAFRIAFGHISYGRVKPLSSYFVKLFYCKRELRCVNAIFFIKAYVFTYLFYAALGFGPVACLGY